MSSVPADSTSGAAAGEGVAFPQRDGARSTTATGRAILADAARSVDPALADRIEGTRDWRKGYVRAVRDLTELSAGSADAALAIARTGLDSMHARMVFDRDGRERSLDEGLMAAARGAIETERLEGSGEPQRELRVPYRGQELEGAALLAQLDRWVAAGVMEPSARAAVGQVVEHPEWLSLSGRRAVLVGAAAEMGPLEPLTAWGADVIALDLPRPDVWDRITQIARHGAGTVTVPTSRDGTRGADLVRSLPEVRAWLGGEVAGDDDLVLGMYAYADGGGHVRVTAAMDALTVHLLERRPGTALAYLATPTDAFVVPDAVMAAAREAWDARRLRRVAQAPLRAVSRGRLFTPAYAGGAPVADVLIPQQGPNYALAKRLQRWRGITAAGEGHTVSFNVAPSAWTRSVTKNRVLAAAYSRAHHFGVEIFDPATSRVLMAAILVGDLHRASDRDRHPEALFFDGAVHGGLWRSAYEPRSVLGLAALAGLPSTLVSRG